MKTHLENNCAVDIVPIEETVQTVMEEKIKLHEMEDKEEAFMLGDLGDVINKYKRWVKKLPRVEPFYAVKCNNEHAVLKVLSDLGCSFDCASKSELQMVMNLGVEPCRIIYANPCKQRSYIRYAAKHHVSLMTFDNEEELHKIKDIYYGARLVLRIRPPNDFKILCELGIKFGCHKTKVRPLLETARRLGLNVVGVSFHVGSGCLEASAFAAAIQQARQVFDIGLDLGFDMNLLDIGGGFPGQVSPPISFNEIAEVVNEALDLYFPSDDRIRIIAEPGRYMVASAFTLVANIIAKRYVARDQRGENGEPVSSLSASDEPAIMYYINDGVYGSFNCLLFDHAHDHVTAYIPREPENELTYECSLWGPTCDGIDCINEKTQLPELKVGDWLYFLDMGAYTTVAASAFNGMTQPVRYYFCSADVWLEIYPKEKREETKKIKQRPLHLTSGRIFQETAVTHEKIPDVSSTSKDSKLGTVFTVFRSAWNRIWNQI
ncbi:hypothetical protein ACJMK2_028258 [Sinanodonta woodiana]|uniref:ornithine decarboxylase n=1 Tax=Sinanodonta woodiana TaxID=1069815 RepID=A0ABD3X867_SINWO